MDDQFGCPVEATLAVIGGKWKAVLIFHMMHTGPHRFAELKRKTAGISDRVLTRQLRELETDGVVCREVFAEVPPRVEYSLTDLGRDLMDRMLPLVEWVAANAGRVIPVG